MKKLLLISLIVIVSVINYTGISSQPSKYEGKIVKAIKFIGLKNMDPEDLLDEMITEQNKPLKSAQVRKDISTIFRKGNFKNVIVEIEEVKGGVQLRITCEERDRINSITFKGYDELPEIELTNVMLVKEGEVFRKELLEKSVKRLKKKYDDEGLFNAVVTSKVIDIKDENRVNIKILIDEGEEIVVEKISILGAKKIYVEDLRSLMDTDESSLFNDGEFKKDLYSQDKGKIVSHYREKGFLDAQIVEDKLTYEWKDPEKREKRVIYLTIKVNEGEKYYFDKYTVKVNKTKGKKNVFKSEDLMRGFYLNTSGELFNNKLFMMDRQGISFRYASLGYIFARVIPKRVVEERVVEVDGKKERRKFVTINFEITEGNKAYIDQIIIKGNKRTLDKVIRREILLKEGELFNSAKMQRSREIVYNLGFFKQVNFDVRPGSKEGYMNLVVDVEEQHSGTISMGGGYGTTTGFSIFADISENNLMGKGQRVGVKFEYGPSRRSITLSFRERWLMDYPLGFSASIFYDLNTIETTSLFTSSTELASHERTTVGYSLGLSYRFWVNFTAGAIWSHAVKNYSNPSGNSTDDVFKSVSLIPQQKLTQSFYLYYDSKNNYLNPSAGIRTGVKVAVTGGRILGLSDDHFTKFYPEFYWYFSPFHLPFLKTHPLVFEFRMNGTFTAQPLLGTGQDYNENAWVESEDKLYMGGPETLRAWDYYDINLPSSWRYGGLYHRVLYGLEFRVPIHPQMLWLAFYFDAGSLWSDDKWELQESSTMQAINNEDKANGNLRNINQFFSMGKDFFTYFRYSYGFGLRIQIPMMPLRFWFGWRMQDENGYFKAPSSELFRFQFAIGDMRF